MRFAQSIRDKPGRGTALDIVSLDGLCIRTTDYKDNDKLITLYCAEKGKITATAKGVKSAKAKLKFCASPFCFGKYQLAAKNGRYTVAGCDVYDGFFSLTADIESYYCGGCVLEVLDKTTADGDFIGTLFTSALRTLKDLCYGEGDSREILRGFLKEAVSALGFGERDMSLAEFSRYFYSSLGVKLNSLSELLRL